MDTTAFTKATGKFLIAEEVRLHPMAVFVITAEGNIVKNEKFGVDKLRLEGEFNKEERILDLSKTNARTIEKALGHETKLWIGKTLSLEVYKTKTSEGKLVEAINVKSVQ